MIEKSLLILYLVTGFITAFDVCYHNKVRGIQKGLFETGFTILMTTLFWLPIGILMIYIYWLVGLYSLITEEET